MGVKCYQVKTFVYEGESVPWVNILIIIYQRLSIICQQVEIIIDQYKSLLLMNVYVIDIVISEAILPLRAHARYIFWVYRYMNDHYIGVQYNTIFSSYRSIEFVILGLFYTEVRQSLILKQVYKSGLE